MGKLNMNLLKGIEETENHMKAAMPEETGKKPAAEDKEAEAEKKPVSKNTVRTEGQVPKKKQVFSFRALITDIACWKAYATATGQTMEVTGTNAMNEYIKRHKLTDAEQLVYEAVKGRHIKG